MSEPLLHPGGGDVTGKGPYLDKQPSARLSLTSFRAEQVPIL